jgi:hypothetical protein
MHPDVEAVLQELDGHRVRFEAFCRSLSEEELERPVPRSDWLVRDFISHLATCDGPVGEMFRTVREGGEPGIRGSDGERWDVDRWNEEQVRERRTRPLRDILGEAAASRTTLRRTLASLTEGDVSTKIKFQGDARRPAAEFELRQYLRGWCKHDVMHALDMSRALPEKVTPTLQAWFDDPVVAGYQTAMNSQS